MKKLTEYKKNGHDFRVVKRRNSIIHAVAEPNNHEVFVVQSHDGRTIGDTYCEPAEYPPSNSQWGSKGWTFMREEEANVKFEELCAQ